jgi:MscS family membrane protein
MTDQVSKTVWLERVMPEALQTHVLGIALWQMIGVLLLIFLSLAVRRVVVYLIASQARRLVGQALPRLDSALEKSARPLSGLVMACIFHVGFPLLGFPPRLEIVAALAVRVLAVASGVWLFYRLSEVLSELMADKAAKTETKLDDQLVPLIRRTLKAFVVVIGSIFILQNLHVDVASLLAGLGLGGLAFALAAKDTVANFFGAITIFIDRPFQIGDWVIIGKFEGTVEDVGFRTTRVRTFYNSLVTIPNATLTGTPVDNMGVRIYRRIKTVLNLTYSTTPDQVQAFVEGIRAIIQAHPHTRKDYYEIHFCGFGAHSLDILVYCFVKTPTWSDELRAKHELYLSILRLAHDLGVEFAFPTQTLHVDSFPEKTPRHTGQDKIREELADAIVAYGPNGKLSLPRGAPLTHGYHAGSTPKGSAADGPGA